MMWMSVGVDRGDEHEACRGRSPRQHGLCKLEGGKDVDLECLPEFAGTSFSEGIGPQLCRKKHEAVKLHGCAKGYRALIAVRFPAQISGNDANECTRRQGVCKSIQTFWAPSHKQEVGMLLIERSRQERPDAGRTAGDGNRSSCQSKVHWLLDRYHAQKDKVIGSFISETVNRFWLDIDGVVRADLTGLTFAESSAGPPDDKDLVFPGVSMTWRRPSWFHDEIPHRKRGDSIWTIQHPAYCCATGPGFSDWNLFHVLNSLDDHDDLQLN